MAAHQRPRKQRSKRSRRRLIIFFVGIFCLVPVLGLVLSSTSIFDRSGVTVQDSVDIETMGDGNTQVPALPGLPDDPSGSLAAKNLKLTAEEAEKANMAVPDSQNQIVSARPFSIPSTVAMELSRQSATNCLTSAIYYEAAVEAPQGQRAVAQVVINRMRHPAYPNNICDVVFQGSSRSTGCQFSFTCDGSLARRPVPAIWNRARNIAASALAGAVEPSVGTATHYHTVWIVPYWAKSLEKITTVGSHIFYRWTGFWGKRAAFTSRYSGENLSGTAIAEIDNDETIALDPTMGDEDETVTFVPEVDPILTPGFNVGDTPDRLPDAGTISADQTDSPIAADREKGTLILD
ncbi:MAG: cell wall hydrolase [Parasphingorhabdus sp.]|uniref:cell wall hydrolase n=1 Tax=Parasphingorhabdus sp. TaxID=2709688 RepID=UPI00326610EE